VGKKVLMALTGVVFVLFVIAHMIGNLKIFMGAEAFNHYAEWLREVGYPVLPHKAGLWIFRVVLLGCVGIHMLAALQLYLASRAARGTKYEKEESLSFSYASRTMRWGGVIIGVFVVYHLMHFTIGNVHPDFVHGAAYENVVIGFQSWPVALVYIVAVGMLGFHLYHGIWSGFQTVGANHPKYNRFRRPLAAVIAVVIFVGFITVPVAVLAGALTLPGPIAP
jgi:succinate dehydrogenase / fumarate reductase cytochrome b subunit